MKTSPNDLPPANILVVDDMPENLDLVSMMLRKHGHHVRTASNGEAALQAAKKDPPDLVLLDIDMPGISGYETAARFKQDAQLREFPIIFLSALDGADDKLRAFASGGVDYVLKPFSVGELDARIKTHLNLRRLQLQLEEQNREHEEINLNLRNLEVLRGVLAAVSKFGMWWTYFQQFDYQSAEPECRRSALDFLAALDQQVKRDKTLSEVLSYDAVEKTVASLRAWANDASLPPAEDGTLSLTKVLLFLTMLRAHIEGQLNSGSSNNTDHLVHPDMARRLENYLKWRGHFPRLKTRADLQDVMERARRTPTIIVVGDIRRSQDLMTYAMDEHDFSTRMVQFISKTRVVLDAHGGFFDKFTGDGFLGYFNESICELYGTNYIDSFLGFVDEFTTFCNAHFREWIKHVRKVPGSPIGLAIGADLGHVTFQSLDYHVVAVSESIVWASRMASAAKAEEVLVNNLLFQALRTRQDLALDVREASTKAGESFQAWKLRITKNAAPPAPAHA